MRFAILGTNKISDSFFEAARRVSEVEVVAVLSRNLDTGAAFAARHGIKRVYTDYEELLSNGEIDAVYVATPTYTHYDYASAALLSGKAVLCEKMMCPEYDEVKRLTSLAKAEGRLLVEAMRPDFDPAYDAVRAALSKIGRVVSAELSFCQYSSRYDKFKAGEYTRAFDPRIKNSALSDIGIYPLHVAISLFGEPVGVDSQSRILDGGFEGEGEIMLSYPDASVKIVYSKIRDSISPSYIVGERGTLFIDKISAPKRVWIEGDGGCEELFSSTEKNNMHHEIRAFCKMAVGEISPEPYIRLVELTAKIISEVYEISGISRYF